MQKGYGDEGRQSDLNQAPISERLHIAIIGKRNVGKSTIMNLLTNQEVSVVSEVAGTTTDPVYKTMEVLPIGPVVFIDTAGYDDLGNLGELRTKKTYEVLRKADFVLYVHSAKEELGKDSKNLLEEIEQRKLPFLLIINKEDLYQVDEKSLEYIKNKGYTYLIGSIKKQNFGVMIREKIIGNSKWNENAKPILAGMVKEKEVVILVTPIDSAAPKGRLILPQQQVLREILNHDAIAIVTKESELLETLKRLKKNPDLVITDSQVFEKVAAEVPKEVALTSFSILFANHKGNLKTMVSGAKKLEHLKEKDKILMVEGCTHHRQRDDIGTVKLPKWIQESAKKSFEFEWCSGSQFPVDLTSYALVIHCGGCMLNQKEMEYRIRQAERQQVAITNYGLVIASLKGLLLRAIEPLLMK